MPSHPDACTELQAAYLTQTTKLAKLTAALGLNGDESTEILVARARYLIITRERLLATGTLLCASAVPSLGQIFVTPEPFDQFTIALEKATAHKLYGS